MNGRRPLWRWRSNPLRRPEDVVEAWIVLAVWVTVVIAGAVVWLVTARAAEHEFAAERADRHPVQAVLLNDASHDAARRSTDGRVQTAVRWPAPDGTARTGRTLVNGSLKAGAHVRLWQDDRGRLALSAPTGRLQGHAEAALFGAGAALASAVPVFGAGVVARDRLDHRRMDRWGQEWELVGRRWGPRPR
ncbi:hypothetical protein [Streptomyces sp. L2]|uniref:Rv1733c family protein n=1 Tax=Streptomyces sp. L2 TaxID=2162665 RepID=UPI001012EA49|nr:hypothetical protein [Streptomyces sp. L2]